MCLIGNHLLSVQVGCQWCTVCSLIWTFTFWCASVLVYDHKNSGQKHVCENVNWTVQSSNCSSATENKSLEARLLHLARASICIPSTRLFSLECSFSHHVLIRFSETGGLKAWLHTVTFKTAQSNKITSTLQLQQLPW